ncbi:unnamed protein product [Adineta steineri]|uniref:Sulfotransferase domain-containing protein n=1 Tax=Adineta steineri TaxID=433720 RepID=A0A814ABU2_9BILA|nr:unnamed protein product [Adineta steineri]
MTTEQVSTSFQLIDGLHAPSYYDVNKFRSGLEYKAQPDDIFIVTYPKSGTTWIEVIVFSLINNGKPFDEDTNDYLMRTPYLERVGESTVSTISRPYSIKTHLPFDRIPYHSQAKYICVIRNPKEVCISLYQFLVKHQQSHYYQCKFNTFFDDFMKGQLPYGDYYQYLRSMWSYKEHENVLIISHEQMQRDIRCVIQRIAQFLNINLIDQDGLLDRVLTFSSYEYMKRNFDKVRKNYSTRTMDNAITVGVSSTNVRNGAVSDRKSCMSDEQSQRFDKDMVDKMQDMPEFEILCR